MTITKNLNGDQLEIVLEGRLDTMTAPDLEQVIRESLDNVKNLTVDMKNLEYVSSAGLRTLLIAKKQLHNKGNVKIVNANDIVKEVFEVTGFDELLDVE
ncbi:STAS domain-containing protein [Butyrivibrio proteoclasticus]|jgi:anti-sigma B factor antagonist|uniref:STAS domain-containing protein n=1 Tax=Butyrivibrio proteoclasticus TaxID=43305 RepID=UPI000479405D|nr:STAS domain-containing protein [Butyrivibrio proteoclasticus]